MAPRLIQICRIQWWYLGKHLFWVKLVPQFKTVCLKQNSLLRLIWICRIQWWRSLFPFLTGNTLFGQIGPKNQNCPFKLQFGISANSNMSNTIVMFTYSVFNRKYPFWVKICFKKPILFVEPKIQIQKKTNSNM